MKDLNQRDFRFEPVTVRYVQQFHNITRGIYALNITTNHAITYTHSYTYFYFSWEIIVFKITLLETEFDNQ